MENKPASFFQAGLIIAIVMILFGLIIYLTGLYKTQQWISYVSYLLLLIMIIVAVMNFAKSKDGYVTFGQCFGWGFKASMITTVLYLLYLVIFILIFPDFKQELMQITREGMEKNDNMSEDQIEAGITMMDKGFYIFMFIGTIFFFLIVGVIGALLGGAFAKKKPISPFNQQTS